jgi:hypothetical protein
MSPLPRQFQEFILKPISQSRPPTSTIVIIIDSLDECGTREERETLLEVLAQDFNDLPIAVRTATRRATSAAHSSHGTTYSHTN